MCHLEKLERLVLSRNALADMPRLLAAFLRRLRSIDLSFNRFKRIPPVLASLTCLQHVDLSGNPDLEARPWPTPVALGKSSLVTPTRGTEALASSASNADYGRCLRVAEREQAGVVACMNAHMLIMLVTACNLRGRGYCAKVSVSAGIGTRC